MITAIEDYFAKGCGRCARFATGDCSTRLWAEGLAELRRICRAAGLEEAVRWGHPCYRLAERNLALIGAFRGEFLLTFLDAALMTDPEGILQKAGPQSRHAGTVRFARTEDVLRLEPVLRAYLAEAMGYARAGVRPPKEPGIVDLPDELVEAMDADPELAYAFHRLTPGRQRSYAIVLAGAKAPATRVARIAKFRARIIAGKGANER